MCFYSFCSQFFYLIFWRKLSLYTFPSFIYLPAVVFPLPQIDLIYADILPRQIIEILTLLEQALVDYPWHKPVDNLVCLKYISTIYIDYKKHQNHMVFPLQHPPLRSPRFIDQTLSLKMRGLMYISFEKLN